MQEARIEPIYSPPENCIKLTRYFYTVAERSDLQLAIQLQRAETKVAQVVTHPLLTHQREALLCLVSDLVAGLAAAPSIKFEKSFLVKALNKGMFQVASAEFHMFCYAEGKVQTRIWEKRKAEQYLFNRGVLLFP